jgi:hypothetical protein
MTLAERGEGEPTTHSFGGRHRGPDSPAVAGSAEGQIVDTNTGPLAGTAAKLYRLAMVDPHNP